MGIDRRLLIKHSLCSLFTTPTLPAEVLSAANKNHWQKEILRKLNSLQPKPREIKCLIPNGCQKKLMLLTNILAEKAAINLELSLAPAEDINTQHLLNQVDKGTGDDIALPATFGLPKLARCEAIHPLDEFVNIYQPKGFQQDALYTLGDYVNDKLNGYQTDDDTHFMFFNNDFLNHPNSAKRYADTFGKRLDTTDLARTRSINAVSHQPDKGLSGGSLFRAPDYLAWEWWVRFHAKGYSPLADDLEPKLIIPQEYKRWASLL